MCAYLYFMDVVHLQINEMTGKGSGVGKVRVELPGSWGEVVDMVNGTNSTTENSKQHLIKSKTQ